MLYVIRYLCTFTEEKKAATNAMEICKIDRDIVYGMWWDELPNWMNEWVRESVIDRMVQQFEKFISASTHVSEYTEQF